MRALISCLLVLMLTAPTIAQEDDGSGDGAEKQCHISANWRVVLVELPDAAGMNMEVNKRDAKGLPDCKISDIKPDFTVDSGKEVLWFTSLSADYLVMTRSTGPIGNVVVQNLNDKTTVVDVVSDDSQADSWGVTYWEHKEAGTAENCTDFANFKEQGFSAVITHETRYDFATKTSLASGMTNCEPAQ